MCSHISPPVDWFADHKLCTSAECCCWLFTHLHFVRSAIELRITDQVFIYPINVISISRESMYRIIVQVFACMEIMSLEHYLPRTYYVYCMSCEEGRARQNPACPPARSKGQLACWASKVEPETLKMYRAKEAS